jgi:hypothetical protein
MNRFVVIAITTFVFLNSTTFAADSSLSSTFMLGHKLDTGDTKDGLYASVDLMKELSPHFGLGGEIGYSKYDNSSAFLLRGSNTMIPLILKARLGTAVGQASRVFFEGGPAYYLMDYQMDDNSKRVLTANGIGAKGEVHDRFGGFLGLGFQRKIGDRSAFNVLGKYFIFKPEIDSTITSAGFPDYKVSYTHEYDSYAIGLGYSVFY